MNEIIDRLAGAEDGTLREALNEIRGYLYDGEPIRFSDAVAEAVGQPASYGDVAGWQARTDAMLREAERALEQMTFPL